MPSGFHVSINEARSSVPCYTRNQRPFLSDTAKANQCNAALQGVHDHVHVCASPKLKTSILQVITIGDCTKAETLHFYRERVLPRVPERLQAALHFDDLYEAFGGKLAHWHDYITDYGECITLLPPLVLTD